MKTVLKFLIAVSIVCGAIVFTSSCKDHDKDDRTTIIGTWNVAQSRVGVSLNANASNTEAEIEAAIANYLQVAVNSKVVFSSTKVTFSYSLNGAEMKSETFDYTLNNSTLSIVLPIDNPKNLTADAGLTDNTLKVTFDKPSYTALLKYYAEKDPDFKTYIDQISEASVYYRLER